MIIFTVEMILLSICKEGYFLGYYFWLDLISTATMILDLMWVAELFSGGSGVEAAASVVRVARASRASRIGAKSTKFIRILRLIRLLKLMKTAQKKLNDKEEEKNHDSSKNVPEKRQKVSKVDTVIMNSAADRGDRKISKRMERIREASCSVIKSEKYNQVSLNCIGGNHKTGSSTRKIEIANREQYYKNHSGNLPAIE